MVSRPVPFTRPSVLAAALALLAAAPVQAAAPTPKTPKIVPGPFSIGGLKLGDTYAAAHSAWGTGDDCSKDDADYKQREGKDLDRTTRPTTCYFFVKDGGESDSGQAGSASVDFENGKVVRVVLNSAQNASYKPTPTGPMAQFKLPKKHLGLGSSMKTLFKTYPKLKRSGNGYALKSGDQKLIFIGQSGTIDVIQLQ